MANPAISHAAQLDAVYADADRRYWVALQSHLVSLRDQGVLTSWRDHEIQSNDLNQTDCHLGTADVIVVFVSDEFLSPKYSFRQMFEQAVLRFQAGDALLLPVMISRVDWGDSSFDGLKTFPKNGLPISEWESADEALEDIASSIHAAIADAQRRWEERSSGDELAGANQEELAQPQRIGRYRVLGVLGEGAFGKVFLARDEELDRRVAIKVPRRQRVARSSDLEAYISEARLVAKLDHSGLVPVFDVGRTNDGLCYVVSKFVEGQDLSRKLRSKNRMSCVESSRLVAAIAEALQHAHDHDIYHRDIKPANILIDNNGKPYLADFGLAIKDEDFGTGSKFAGTPPYMSPEQARGEGHRIDGRSDIFSLGIVYYQLITGRRPFRSKTVHSLLAEIKDTDARPPRQIDSTLPKEVERICLKAMSNRAKDRYTTAKDLADDLHYFLDNQSHIVDSPSSVPPFVDPSAPSTQETHGTEVGSRGTGSRRSSTAVARTTVVDKPPQRIVPKGLRAFDQDDADFFLDLLPGPRDRNGLPESIQFWKRHIEPSSEAPTFPIGLIYGPSGCGKTSFMRAGLLPRLSSSVVVITLEASARGTAVALKRKLDRRFPSLSTKLGIADAIAAVRRGQVVDSDGKLLIVIDQFEQWWQARERNEESELLDALRQCDGQRAQCILMTRVDYLMGIHDFMDQLEVPIREGVNSAAVDLFDSRHARKVLTRFGVAHGCLPEETGKLSRENKAFLAQAVEELSDRGKVVPVQLVVFADMTKGRSWTSRTLSEIGGAKGIGVSFLEETFTADTSPLEHRIHQHAAKSVLKALLPEPGQDIRGGGRSHHELLVASRYENRPRDFAALIDILDRGLRLVTPVGNAVDDAESSSVDASSNNQPSYQLTHDYLVPSLREWLSRKQKETARGRAEIQLEERTALWDEKRQTRQLPSLWEFIRIRWWTRRAEWLDAQREMMGRAARYFAVRWSVAMVCLALVIVFWMSLRAKSLVDRLVEVEMSEMPELVDQIDQLSFFSRRHLERLSADSLPRAACLASVALHGIDDDDTHLNVIDDYLVRTSTPPAEIAIIANQTRERNGKRLAQLWTKLVSGSEEERLRAACALAVYDPDSQRWSESVRQDVAAQIVSLPPDFVDQWIQGLLAIRNNLLDPLERIYLDPERSEIERTTAVRILSEFGPADDAKYWVRLLVDADNRSQLDVFLGKLPGHRELALQELSKRLVDAREASSRDALRSKQAKVELHELDDLWVRFETLQNTLEAIDTWRESSEDQTAAEPMQRLIAKLGRLLGESLDADLDAQQIFDQFEKRLQTLDNRGNVSGINGSGRPNPDPATGDAALKARIAINLRRLLQLAEERISRLPQDPTALQRKTVNLAVALLRLGDRDKAWPLLKKSPDPSLRSQMIHALGSLGVKPHLVVNQLLDGADPRDDSIRMALILSLGRYDWRQVTADPEVPVTELMQHLETSYETDPSSGIHGAAGWLLKKWKQTQTLTAVHQRLDRLTGLPDDGDEQDWYATGQQQTMVIVRSPKVFLAGSPSSEIGREAGPLVPYEKQHRMRIPRSFAISATEVTLAQFLKFPPRKDHLYTHTDADHPLQCPVNGVNWYDAAAYCNWLSAQEGIPFDQWCYPKDVASGIDVRVPVDYLRRTGYRLPTEAEWEYACRAGSSTSRFFGETPQLMASYALCEVSTGARYHTQPVALLMPNDLGLFDMLGNVAEWCHVVPAMFDERTVTATSEDTHDGQAVDPHDLRVFRGGSFQYATSLVRSAGRDRSHPDYRYFSMGFRVARTIEADEGSE